MCNLTRLDWHVWRSARLVFVRASEGIRRKLIRLSSQHLLILMLLLKKHFLCQIVQRAYNGKYFETLAMKLRSKQNFLVDGVLQCLSVKIEGTLADNNFMM